VLGSSPLGREIKLRLEVSVYQCSCSKCLVLVGSNIVSLSHPSRVWCCLCVFNARQIRKVEAVDGYRDRGIHFCAGVCVQRDRVWPPSGASRRLEAICDNDPSRLAFQSSWLLRGFAHPRQEGSCGLTRRLSRQPSPLLFAVVLGNSLLLGFAGAQSPAAAAQLHVRPICTR
jgi:hypothetical protein